MKRAPFSVEPQCSKCLSYEMTYKYIRVVKPGIVEHEIVDEYLSVYCERCQYMFEMEVYNAVKGSD